MTKSIEQLQKALKIRNIIIILMGIGVGAIAVLFMLKNAGPDTSFNEPVDTDTAFDNIRKYRNRISFSKKTKLVWYEAENIKKYMNEIYPKLIDRYEVPADHRWVLGFYFMRKLNKDGDPRGDFYVIPTLVGKDNKPLDYYADYERYRPKAQRRDDEDFAYNLGQVWP